MRTDRAAPWACALGAVLLVLAWQAATVAANYGGRWSALFCTGELQPRLTIVASEGTYLFAHSNGYDGQFYHYIAHDPWMRGSDARRIDDPPLRYRRILAPALAWTLALGRSAWIDAACRAVCWLAIGLGVYWSCLLARKSGIPAAWGMVFLLFPAVPVTVDRMVPDAALAALTVAFILWVGRPSRRLWVVLCAAALTRETGILLAAAWCGYLAWHGRRRAAAVFGLSILPALAWYGYVEASAPSGRELSKIRWSALLETLAHGWQYPAGTPLVALVEAADYAALAGLMLAIVLGMVWFVRRMDDLLRIAAMLLAAAAAVLQIGGIFVNVFSFGRVYTPLLVLLAVFAVQDRRALLLAPAVLMLPRVAIQFVPQMLGIVRYW